MAKGIHILFVTDVEDVAFDVPHVIERHSDQIEAFPVDGDV